MKYAQKMSKISQYMQFSLKYAIYARSMWAHFTGNVIIITDGWLLVAVNPKQVTTRCTD